MASNSIQIYIDGVLMDVDKGTKVTLDIKSNLFRDISKILSNTTYSIKLPKTARNIAVLGNNQRVQATNKALPYKLHRADYFHNGVCIIRNGSAVILSISDSIEITITWGTFPLLYAINEKGLTLNQLKSDKSVILREYMTPDYYATMKANGLGVAKYKTITNGNESTYRVGLQKKSNGALVYTTIYPTYNAQCWDIEKVKAGDTFLGAVNNSDGFIAASYDVVMGDEIYIEYDCQTLASLDWVECDESGLVLERGHYENERRLEQKVIPRIDTKKLYYVVKDAQDVTADYNHAIRRFTPFTTLNGDGVTDENRFLHPSALVNWVLARIGEQTGINLEMCYSQKEFLSNLAIPIINKSCADENKTVARFSSAGTFDYNKGTCFNLSADFQEIPEISLWEEDNKLKYISINEACKLKIEFKATVKAEAFMATFDKDGRKITLIPFATIIKKDADNNETYYPDNRSLYVDGEELTANKGDVNTFNLELSTEIDCEAGDKLYFGANYILSAITEASCNVRLTMVSEDVPYGDRLYLSPNLPEIKIVDFLKSICMLTGTFVKQTSTDGKIQLIAYNEILNNKAKAYDWSRYLMQSNEGEPKNIEYTLSEYARNNWYKWKDDDTVERNYDGNFAVDNAALDAERTVITLPFAASDGNKIPLYTKKYDDTQTDGNGGLTYDYKSVKERLLSLKLDGDKASLFFDLDLQGIIGEKYGFLQDTLRNPKVIKDNFALDDLEVVNFDETIPVYLAQYGAYFAVLELKQNDNGTAEATLLKLNFDNYNPITKRYIELKATRKVEGLTLTTSFEWKSSEVLTEDVNIIIQGQSGDADIESVVLPSGNQSGQITEVMTNENPVGFITVNASKVYNCILSFIY